MEVKLTPEQLEDTITALKTDKKKRTRGQLDTIMSYLKKLPLFEEDISDLNSQRGLYHTLNALALNIQYEKCEKGQIAIEYESTGKTFYIIVKGSVTVYIPDNRPNISRIVTQRRATFKTSLEQHEEMKFIDMGHLGPGRNFGERACLTGKPRMARIQCNEECHFAIVRRNDYRTIIGALHQQKKTALAEFLKQMPFISHWSITHLSKLSEIVEKTALIRNQYLIKEKEPLKYIYIIRSGEFETFKTFPKVDQELKKRDYDQKVLKPMLRVSRLCSPQAKKNHKNALTNALFVSPRMKIFFNLPKTRRISLGSLSKGQIVSENDAHGSKISTVAVKCRSSAGEVYRIAMNDFLSYLKRDPDAWQKFSEHSKAKDKEIIARVSNYRKQFRNFSSKNRLQPKNLKSFLRNLNPNELDVRRTMREIVKNKNNSFTNMETKTMNSQIREKRMSLFTTQASFRNLHTSEKRLRTSMKRSRQKRKTLLMARTSRNFAEFDN
ncbi:unnamed protein product [Moneuplotes crassus]|uniref:Cyclic nucleotide-binding domain-containing protein n=1 Tax=Euplotes crassus TaxID=5936 RepID=A0AAD1UCS6_EUPCR|nr:unnamed protein product [Moneuplotes crassus]